MGTPSNMSNYIVRYIGQNRFVSLVGLYLIISSLVMVSTGLNIGIPCLWKSVFGFDCPGCGLTTAFVSVLKFDFVGAYRTNFLIFILIPIGFIYMLMDFQKFKSER